MLKCGICARCVRACMLVQVYMYVHAYGGPRSMPCLSLISTFMFWDRISYWTWSITVGLGCMANELQGFIYLLPFPSVLGLKTWAIPGFLHELWASGLSSYFLYWRRGTLLNESSPSTISNGNFYSYRQMHPNWPVSLRTVTSDFISQWIVREAWRFFLWSWVLLINQSVTIYWDVTRDWSLWKIQRPI